MFILPGIVSGVNVPDMGDYKVFASDILTPENPWSPSNMVENYNYSIPKVHKTAFGPSEFGGSVFDTEYTATLDGDNINLNGRHFVKIHSGIVNSEFDLSFDGNGYPIIVYTNTEGVYAYYRHNEIFDHYLIELGGETPYVTLNSQSLTEITEAKNIVLYKKGNGFISCSTNDLFSAKYGLLVGTGVIHNAGLSTGNFPRMIIEVDFEAAPATYSQAAITNLVFDDDKDVADFTVSHAGNIYWGTSPTGQTPTQDEVRSGTGPVLEKGTFSAGQSTSFIDDYTGASGAHLQVRQLNLFVEPFDAFVQDSPILPTSIQLFLTPLKFEPTYWDLENEGDGTTVLLDIEVLPHDNGDPITVIEYNLNDTGWVDLGSTARGTYEIPCVNGQLQTFKVRSFNSNGASYPSTEKSVVPEVTTHDRFIFSEWQADQNVTGINGSVITEGAEVFDWLGVAWPGQTQMNFGARYSRAIYRATGTPNGGPYIEFASGDGMEAEMGEIDFPLGNANRTMVVVIRVPQYQPSYPAAPLYGLPANGQAFGMSLNPDYKPLFDYWGTQVIGTTSFDDYTFKVVFISHRKSVSRVFVNNVLENEQMDVTLDTQQGKVYLGRVEGASRSGFEIASIMMYDHGLSTTHRTQVQNYLSNKYLV